MTRNARAEGEFLRRLRQICLELPEVEEVRTWGHPTFKAAGKTFAVYETYKGEPSLAIQCGLAAQPALVAGPRFYRTPYIGAKGWVSLRVGGDVDWSEIQQLVHASYRRVVPKRLLHALGDSGANA